MIIFDAMKYKCINTIVEASGSQLVCHGTLVCHEAFMGVPRNIDSEHGGRVSSVP